MDNTQYINLLARIEAVKVEIDAAKLDNKMRLQYGPQDHVSYPPSWFLEKADELRSIGNEPFR